MITLIIAGLIFLGFIIGYPLGSIFGRRHALYTEEERAFQVAKNLIQSRLDSQNNHRPCKCEDCRDILSAEVIQ